MQITNIDPRVISSTKAVRENIFCLGDCTQTSLNEEKGITPIHVLSEIVEKNLDLLAKGKKASSRIS